jgi:peptidoglycan/xylan/chitin deacetylase (PgdA/CDA1 family)
MPALLPTLALAASALSPAGNGARLSILIYHRVCASPDPLFPVVVDRAVFSWHLDLLKRCFNVLPLADAVARLRKGQLPSKAVCITFDDGYSDNAQVALPILQQYGLPATFFVSTSFLNGGLMWNDLVIESVRGARGDRLDLRQIGLGEHDIATLPARRQAIKQLIGKLKYLEPSARGAKVEELCAAIGVALPGDLMMADGEVLALHRAGMEIGGHTVTHPILASQAPNIARREIAEGKERLEAIIGDRVTLFAYPNGKPKRDYSHEHVEMVKKLGFAAAVSTAWGVATKASDRYQLPRFSPWDKTPTTYLLRLTGNLLRTSPELA